MINIRASSLPELMDCPARWFAKVIQGKRVPMRDAAALGKAIHASTAAFDAARLRGSPISADDAAGAAVDSIAHPNEDVLWDEIQPDRATSVAVALHTKYCREIAPKIEYEAVEAKCDGLVISDLDITLTGTIDRVYRDQFDDLGVADLKSGKTAVGADGTVKTQGHGLQLATYELLAESATGKRITAPAKIIGLQTGLTDKGQRVGVGQLDSPRDALIGTAESPGALQYASQFIKSGNFFGNPRSVLCSEKYCPAHATCMWRK